MAAKKGHPKAGGRKPGTPNKTTAAVKAALIEAFDQLGGVPALVRFGRKNPAEFYRLWAKLLPTEIKNADGQPFGVHVTEVVVTTRLEADSVLALNRPDVRPALPDPG